MYVSHAAAFDNDDAAIVSFLPTSQEARELVRMWETPYIVVFDPRDVEYPVWHLQYCTPPAIHGRDRISYVIWHCKTEKCGLCLSQIVLVLPSHL
jgi:hypothetical protein